MRHKARILAAAAALAGIVLSSAPAVAEKVSLAMDWILNGKHAPFFIGIDRGTYRGAGLEMKILRGYGSSMTVSKVAANSVEYGFADAGSVIIGRSRRAKVMLLAIIHEKMPHVIYSLGKKGIWTPKDLKGKRIGAPTGDAVRVLFPAFARANGLDPNRDVRWTTITGAAKPASLLSGLVDAITNYVTDGPPLFEQAAKLGKKINTLAFPDWGVDIYSNGLIAQESRVRTNPSQAKAVVSSVMRSWAWAVENPKETIRLYQKYVPAISPDLARKQLDIAIGLMMTRNAEKWGIGYIVKEKMDRTIQVVSSYMVDRIKKRPKAREVYTNSFLPRLFPQWKKSED